MRLRRGYVLWSGTALAVAAFALSHAIGAVADLVSGSRDSQGVSLRDLGSIGSFTPANADPRLAARYAKAVSQSNHTFRFTQTARKRVVQGQSVCVHVAIGGRSSLQKKK